MRIPKEHLEMMLKGYLVRIQEREGEKQYCEELLKQMEAGLEVRTNLTISQVLNEIKRLHDEIERLWEERCKARNEYML